MFRATLTLASAWIIETVGGEQQPGGDRWKAALSPAKTQVNALRLEFAEDGLSQHNDGIDFLITGEDHIANFANIGVGSAINRCTIRSSPRILLMGISVSVLFRPPRTNSSSGLCLRTASRL